VVVIIRKLPEQQRESSLLKDNIFSPQLQEALATLDKIVYSEECENIFKSFGIWDQAIFESASDRKSNQPSKPSSR
jgi:hypothetical protein